MTTVVINSTTQLQNTWNENLKDFYGSAYFSPMIKPINSFLLKHKKLDGNLLDIGCGYGEKANVFSKIGFGVTGIDYSSERIQSATLKFPEINFFHYEIKSKLPFDDDSFDVVFSSSAFQYLDHESILTECKRILKKDGCLVLVENLKNNPITRIGRAYLKIRKYNYQSYPFNHFTYNEINNLKNNFTDAEIFFMHLLSPLAFSNYTQNLYPQLHAIDNYLLKLNPLRRLTWLTLFMAVNKK